MSSQKAPSVGWALGFQWVLANTVGLVVSLMVGFVGLFLHGALFGVIAGTAVGIMQWLVLREYISRAGSWAAACTVGGAVGGALAWFVGWIGVEFLRQNIPGGMPTAEDGMRHLGKIVGVPMVLTVGGAMAGVVTGPMLIWLLRHPRSEAHTVVGNGKDGQSTGRDA